MKNKYSIILGNLGNTCDRFCKSYKSNPTSEQMLDMAVKKIPHIEGIELVGTWDISANNVKEMRSRLNDYGLTCSSIIPDTFTDKEYAKGSITNIKSSVRNKAIDYLREMSDIALEMNCKLLNLWLGQDGYDYILTADYDQEREWMKEATVKLATNTLLSCLLWNTSPKNQGIFPIMPVWQILSLQPKKPDAIMWE